MEQRNSELEEEIKRLRRLNQSLELKANIAEAHVAAVYQALHVSFGNQPTQQVAIDLIVRITATIISRGV